jgi:hypothetical protein
MVYAVFFAFSFHSLIGNFFIVKPIEEIILGIVEEPEPEPEEAPQEALPEEFPEWEDMKGE